jgi:hypothetical protein
MQQWHEQMARHHEQQRAFHKERARFYERLASGQLPQVQRQYKKLLAG